MELTWYGRTCIRLRGKDAVVVTDPYQSVVGPTGRGITGDIVTFSHADDTPLPRAKGRLSRDGGSHLPTSLDDAFVLDGPGEYEVKHILLTGSAPIATTAAAPTAVARSRSWSRSTGSTRSTSGTSATS
jgi:L-ascorbate metabolism protein UlaG (beta-lactamase superfamily)